MLTLRAVQARYGDSLVVEFGSPDDRHYLLVDGGPPDTYAEHLEAVLREIAEGGGRLDLAVLSHVDLDHVAGLVDLMTQLMDQRANGRSETIAVDGLWHNSFTKTVDTQGDLAPRLMDLIALAGGPQAMTIAGMAVDGIEQGDKLRLDALQLKIPINVGFADSLICVDTAPNPIELGALTVHICGPTRANLDELQKEWRDWLDKHEDAVAAGPPLVAEMADISVPNLSSIAMLVEADDHRILLTGDGRGDHLLDGLRQAGLLDEQDSITVDVLKVAHHGSDRDATRAFFDSVKADTYVISADGRYGNPDLATLIWIVESAVADKRQIRLVSTNRTPSTDKLQHQYPPAANYYSLEVMQPGADSIIVDAARALAPG